MKAYSYHSVTKEFKSEIECQLDPLESQKQNKDIYLLPSNSTLNMPLEKTEKKIYIFENNKWVIKDDYRNIVFYDKETKEKKIISEINVLPDNNWTEIEPLALDDTCKWDVTKWIIDNLKVEELEKNRQKEQLINDKIRKQAIDALKADGVLDSNGDLI